MPGPVIERQTDRWQAESDGVSTPPSLERIRARGGLVPTAVEE
jgi:hypothetical protein